MNLLKTYFKLMIIRNKRNYLLVVLSIIFAYLSISLIMVYMDNVLYLSSEFMYPRIHYIYTGFRSVIIIGGIFFIIIQYYNIMKSSLRDYCIFKTLGATKRIIRILITLQEVVLIFITLPIGLFFGNTSCILIINSFANLTVNDNVIKLLDSFVVFIVFTVIASSFIICIGFHLEKSVRKLPLSVTLSDKTSLGKEVSWLW